MSKELDAVLKQLPDQSARRKLPPVDTWNPPLSGDIDIVIKRNGLWFHEGDEIQRHELACLFSTILKREGDDYFLVTPVEKWRLTVEDVPFYITGMDVLQQDGQRIIVFTTFTNDKVVLSKTNPLRVVSDPETGEPSPYLMVRNNMEGLVSRHIFYRLAESAQLKSINGAECYFVNSLGEDFIIG